MLKVSICFEFCRPVAQSHMTFMFYAHTTENAILLSKQPFLANTWNSPSVAKMFPIFDTERHYVKMLPLPYLNPPPPASTNHGLTLQETQARLSLGMHLSHESRHSAFANHNTAEW